MIYLYIHSTKLTHFTPHHMNTSKSTAGATKNIHRIGHLIKEIRVRRGLTQSQFAEKMQTSQSAVARIESGEQNLSIEQIEKISDVLGHPLVHMSHNVSDDFRIRGGKELKGSIRTNPSKNGAMGLLCAALLNKGVTTLHYIPRIEEVNRLLEVFGSIGVKTRWLSPSSEGSNGSSLQESQSVEIRTPQDGEWSFDKLDIEAAKKMRTTLMMIGPLVHRLKTFFIPHSGGCSMGERTINAHRLAFEALGISVNTKNERYEVDGTGVKAGTLTMYEASDTATENIFMAASLIPKKTTIHFAQENYMVQDVIGFLRVCGVKIERENISTVHVTGVQEIRESIEYWNSEDPIESMAFVTAAIMTKSTLTVTHCPIDFIRLELYKLELMGQKMDIGKEYFSKNGFTKLVDIVVKKSALVAPKDKLHPLPYPGINVDNLPFFVPICTQAEGTTLINDWMWENRALYFTELNRLGANITLADPHRVFVQGVTPLKAAQIVCPPALRPSMIIFLAMLGAPGTSTLRNVYSINRGYENIAERLNALGADIERITDIG